MIRLLVGLGNPGPEYEATRHNAGFWWVDDAARKLGAHLSMDRSYQGFVARVNVGGQPRWLLQPQTFMNLSGRSVGALARFFKILPEEVLVVHDELDLPPGQVKLKFGGGHAGHNGLKDIQAQLGSPGFWRLRLGIGHPGDRAEVSNYVLGRPRAEDREAIEAAIARSLTALEALWEGGDMASAIRQIHATPPRPKPPRKTPSEGPAAGPQAPDAKDAA